MKAAGGVLTAKQAPHRPGTAPAHGLRAERAVVILSQTTTAKETTMLFRSLLTSLKSRPRVTGGPRPTGRLQVEALEDRSVPAIIADPVGDIMPTYAGGVLPGMDVVAHEVVLLEEQDRVVFYGKMAGSVADTQSVHALYLFGVDRGSGTARFLSTPGPVIGPHVVWDSIVRVNPDGTGLFNNV